MYLLRHFISWSTAEPLTGTFSYHKPHSQWEYPTKSSKYNRGPYTPTSYKAPEKTSYKFPTMMTGISYKTPTNFSILLVLVGRFRNGFTRFPCKIITFTGIQNSNNTGIRNGNNCVESLSNNKSNLITCTGIQNSNNTGIRNSNNSYNTESFPPEQNNLPTLRRVSLPTDQPNCCCKRWHLCVESLCIVIIWSNAEPRTGTTAHYMVESPPILIIWSTAESYTGTTEYYIVKYYHLIIIWSTAEPLTDTTSHYQRITDSTQQPANTTQQHSSSNSSGRVERDRLCLGWCKCLLKIVQTEPDGEGWREPN